MDLTNRQEAKNANGVSCGISSFSQVVIAQACQAYGPRFEPCADPGMAGNDVFGPCTLESGIADSPPHEETLACGMAGAHMDCEDPG